MTKVLYLASKVNAKDLARKLVTLEINFKFSYCPNGNSKFEYNVINEEEVRAIVDNTIQRNKP